MSGKKIIAFLAKPFIIFTIFFLLYSFLNLMPKPQGVTVTSGDEPHYLIMTHSLLRDGDLDLENNYKNGDYRNWFPEGKLDTHLLRFNGKAYAHHQVGMPLLLLPGFSFGGHIGAVLTLTFLTSLGLVNLNKILRLFADQKLALLVTFLVGLSVPVGIYSGLVYPEVPLFALLSFSFLTILKPEFKLDLKQSLILFMSASFLPLFHIKFAVLLVLVLLLTNFIVYKKVLIKNLLLFNLLMLIPLAIYTIWWASYFDWQLITAYAKLNKDSSILPTNIPSGLLAYLVDRENGTLIFAPFYIFIVQGVVSIFRNEELKQKVRPLFLISLAYILFFTMYKYLLSGINPSGRFFLPIIPGMAIPLVIGLKKMTAYQWALFKFLGIYSVVIFFLFAKNPLLSFPSPNFQSNLIYFLFKENAPFIQNLLPNLSKFGREIQVGDYLKGVIILGLLFGLVKAETIWKFKRLK